MGVAPGCTIHAVRVLNGTNRIETEGGNSAFRGLVEVLKDYNSVRPIAQHALVSPSGCVAPTTPPVDGALTGRAARRPF